jgi:hypothetical protein
VNARNAIILDLDLDCATMGALPHGSKDLGNGYILLCACEAEPHPLRACEAVALQEFLPSALREGDISVHH